jgi:hypothetical protein
MRNLLIVLLTRPSRQYVARVPPLAPSLSGGGRRWTTKEGDDGQMSDRQAQPPSSAPQGLDDHVLELRRWEDSGGHWSVVRRDSHNVVLSLRRCDGGEEAARLTSGDPRLIAYIGARLASW